METPAHHVDIIPADPGNQAAAPALASLSSGSAPLLRQRLADAIAARNAADDAAAAAGEVAARAASAEADAALTIEYLKRDIDAAGAAATQAHAEAITAAFRRGEALPATPAPAAVDSAALALALSRLAALRQSARELSTEADAATLAAARAAADVNRIIDAIMTADARAIAAEWIAAVQICWELQDRLAGLARLNESLLPDKLQAELLEKVSRRKRAIAADPRMIETPNFNAYVDDLQAAAEKQWRNYARRLAESSEAAFEEFSR